MNRIIDFRKLLLEQLSKSNVNKIVHSVLLHPEDLDELYNLTKDENIKVSWRAIWACEKISEQHPELLIDRQEEITARLIECKHHGSKRLLLSTLYNMPVQEPFPVHFLDFCFNHMLDVNEAAAAQALCMKMSYKLCLVERELLPELKLYLENAEPDYYSAAVKSTVRNILRKLN